MTKLRKTISIAIEAVLVLVLLAVLASSVLLWRLQQGPVNIAFARDRIVSTLSSSAEGLAVNVDDMYLTWPDWKGPLVIDVRGLRVLQNNETRVVLDQASISIARLPLLVGYVRPIAAIFKSPGLKLAITEDGNYRLLSVSEDNQSTEQDLTIDSAGKSEPVSIKTVVDIIRAYAEQDNAKFSQIPILNSFLQRFHAIRIEDATVSIEDHRRNVTWVFPTVEINAARDDGRLIAGIEIGKEGDATPPMLMSAEIDPQKNGGLAMSFKAYRLDLIPPLKAALNDFFDQKFKLIESKINMAFDLRISEEGLIEFANGELSAPTTAMLIPGQIEEAVVVKDLLLSVNYNRAEAHLDISRASVTVGDIPISIKGDFNTSENGISGPVGIYITSLTTEQLNRLWPKVARDTDVAEWLLDRMQTASLTDIYACFSISAGPEGYDDWDFIDEDEHLMSWWLDPELPIDQNWAWSFHSFTGQFDYTDLALDYEAPLNPVTNAKGRGTYQDGTLSIGIEEGKLGDIDVTNGRVTIAGLEGDVEGKLVVEAPFKAPLVAMIDYVSKEPIALDPSLLADPKQIKGQTEGVITVTLPTEDIMMEDVIVTVEGKGTGVAWPDVVSGYGLTDATMDVVVKEGTLSLKGNGTLGTKPVTFDWSRFVGTPSANDMVISKLTADLETDDQTRPQLGFPLNEEVTGIVPINVAYTEKANEDADMTIKADLTRANLLVDILGYKKPSGIQASGSADLHFKGETLATIEAINLTLPDGSIKDGKLAFVSKDGPYLTGGSFPQITLPGQALKIDFSRPANDKYKLDIVADRFNAEPVLNEKPQAAATAQSAPAEASTIGYDISLSAKTFTTGENSSLSDTRVGLTLLPDGAITYLSLNANTGKGRLDLRFAPGQTADGNDFYIQSDDAGGALNGLGMFEDMVGGQLVAKGKSTDGKTMSNMTGQVDISNFTLVRAPGLARVLNALSISGMGQLLSGSGLSFAKLQTSFDWREDDTGKYVNLTGGRTSGASLGLTFGGSYDRLTKNVNLRGTIIPVSEINTLLSKIPVIGNLLLGGKDGSLFAATYTMKGPAEDPSVLVNPLSVLTPGIIREVLFETDRDKPPARPRPAAQTGQSRPNQ